jgi:hypothetical protein
MPDTKNPPDDGIGSATTNPSPAEHRHNCKAKRTGFGDYVACLEPPPQRCGYAFHMGDEYLCLHPHHLEIAAQAEARLAA